MSVEAVVARPLRGALLEKNRSFLAGLGLDFDGAELSVLLMEDGEIAASGSRTGNLIKGVGVAPERQGDGLAARLMSILMSQAAGEGLGGLFLFTKPENVRQFSGLGFYELAETADSALMESRRHGLESFLAAVPRLEGTPGFIAVNCCPPTRGHVYLMEKAARQCDGLYVFVLSQEGGLFSAAERLEMVKLAAGHIKNAVVLPGGPYVISPATFPDYFIKDKARSEEINCRLDIELFSRRIAPELGIRTRFAGTEPLCPVTAEYNRLMKMLLPERGIDFVEVPRLSIGGTPVSAGRARRLMAEKNYEELRELLPEGVWHWLQKEGRLGRI